MHSAGAVLFCGAHVSRCHNIGGMVFCDPVLATQVWFTNWLTTYGEAVVRVPQRAFTWTQQGLIGRDVAFVVCSTCPSMASHSAPALLAQAPSACLASTEQAAQQLWVPICTCMLKQVGSAVSFPL